MANKVFLSHSSVNKDFVEQVADLLGRDRSFLDEYDFHTGITIDGAINQTLDSSDLFAFFASVEALDSPWVKRELERASTLGIQSRFLTYVVDTRIKIDDIPEWLREYKIYLNTLSPYAVYLDIREHLKEVNPKEQARDIFIGRTSDIELFETARYDRKPKKVFLWNGLSGIGRRSIIKNIALNRLNIKKYEIIPFKKGEDLRTLLLRIAGVHKSKDEILKLYVDSNEMNSENIITLISDELHESININHIFPIFVDDGGMIDSEGYLYEQFGLLFDHIDADNRQPYFFAAVHRKPRQSSVGGTSFITFRVEEFDRFDAKKLINARIQVENVNIPDDSYDEILEMTRGNPELIVLAIKDYKASGYISQSLRDKFLGFYSDYLSRYLSDPIDVQICRPLIEYETLPLEVIQAYTKIAPLDFEKRVENLVNSSIIRRRDKSISFSPSLINAAKRNNFSPLTSGEKRSFSNAMFQYLKNDTSDNFSIHLLEVFYEASNFSDSKIENPYPFLKTSAFTLLNSYFSSRKYLKFVDTYKSLSEKVPEIRSDHSTNYQYVTALINSYNFVEAEDILSKVKLAPFQVSFLKGLLSRKQGDWHGALSNFTEAEKQNYRGPAIISELARANLMLGNYEDAMVYVEKFRENFNMREDSYSLDIAIQANYRMGHYEEFDRLMEKLRLLDEATYLFRNAYINYEEGYLDEAYRDISECISINQRDLPEYNIHSLMVKCCLNIARDLPKNDRQEYIDQIKNSIDKMETLVKRNSTLGRYLSAMLALKGDYEGAKRVISRERKRNERAYNSAMLFIYEIEIKEASLTLAEKKIVQANIDLITSSSMQIRSDLKDIIDNRFTHMKE